MATICENIPNPQPQAARAKRNHGLGTRDRCPERWRTLEKRNRNGPAHWACGTEAHTHNSRAAPRWCAGPIGPNSVPHIGRATPFRSRISNLWDGRRSRATPPLPQRSLN
uniref:Uncharacterized protein n=1 Tax=Oryza nivara TaxID=4536 RepID=A0A0E0FMT4_ORYNI